MPDGLGRTDLHYAAMANDAARVRELAALGLDVNERDRHGYTPLHFAAQERRRNAAEALLAAGAHVDAEDQHGNTPLWTAVFNSKGDGSVIELLREHGADCDHRNAAGRTPVELARTIGNYPVAAFFSDLR